MPSSYRGAEKPLDGKPFADLPWWEAFGDPTLKALVEEALAANYDARIAGYRELNKLAVETGATMPLLQSVQTLVRKKNLTYSRYGNGWVLPQSMAWS